MSKSKYNLNKCGACRHFERVILVDAYGKKYQVCRCVNKKASKDTVKSNQGACRRWARKRIPKSGDFCYYIMKKIYYDSSTPKNKLPCFNCTARCIFSFHKKDKDFTQTKRRQVYMEDIESQS